MKDKFCFVVFSHADTEEKDKILNECLSSIKKVGIKIILSSHIPVSRKNQDLCDYFIKDNNNLILTESEIFNNFPEIFKETYCVVDYFGGMRFETSVFKKTYQPAVFNLYIGAFRVAKSLGFENVILWEHDYILGEKSIDFILKNIEEMGKNHLESISFESSIKIFNNDVVEKEIDCCYAIPAFFNLDKFLSIIPSKFIETPGEFTNLGEMMILEQWIKKKIISECNPKIEYSYSDYSTHLPDTQSGKIHSQNNYLFMGLRSGIYFNEDKAIVAFNNSSETPLNISFLIIDEDSGNILFRNNFSLPPRIWRYFPLENKIYEKFKSDPGCKILESVEEEIGRNLEIFEYNINKRNIGFLSSLKKYSIS